MVTQSVQSSGGPHVQSPPTHKGMRLSIDQHHKDFNFISIWFFLPKAVVAPVLKPNIPELSNWGLPSSVRKCLPTLLNFLIQELRQKKKKEGERERLKKKKIQEVTKMIIGKITI